MRQVNRNTLRRVASEGPITQVSVRVATFGDRPVSDGVLYRIGMHLAPVSSVPQPVAQVPGSPGVVQAGVLTAPPPLANSSSSSQTAPSPSGPPQPLQPAKSNVP